MTDDWTELEEAWEPWRSESWATLEVKDSEGNSVMTPFTGYGPTFRQARLTMKLHLGVLLRQHGYHPAWLKED